MRTVAIIQARCNSIRFPNKVLREVVSKPLISLLITRLSAAVLLDEIVLATTTNPGDDKLAEIAEGMGINCYRGEENDVLARYLEASRLFGADVVVRITGDCPLIDADLVDQVISEFLERKVDYCSNSWPPTYPDGLDVEVFSVVALKYASENATASFDREHVTPFIRDCEKFSKATLSNSVNLSEMRWTVDELEDFELVKSVFEYFDPEKHFSWMDVLRLAKAQPALFASNKKYVRNEGSKMSESQKLWRRAKNVIPGGNMLLSKRPEMFAPSIWPAYFKKTLGIKVWDLDGNEFIDMSLMGVGTNLLGYSNTEVDEAVRSAVDEGNLSTLNCPEEVYLAERLVELHPWSDMVKLARTGGEVNAIATRIARAASGKSGVAVCGYHGWHDWYLAANISPNDNLDQHLLPGLKPDGVPAKLGGTTFTFAYNDFEALSDLLRTQQIGVVVMEVMRNERPKNDFLMRVRKITRELGVVLIFDECTSGFRQSFGGLHLEFGVEPDLATFGKALGNGYAITAVIGRRDIMEFAQSSFISSTFWTERLGPTAALKSLEVMERERSWEKVSNIGEYMKKRWAEAANICGVNIVQSGLPALASFNFPSENNLAYKTLIVKEMLKFGYLASNSFYACTCHTHDMIDEFVDKLLPTFKLIKKCEDGEDINSYLKTAVCHSGFTRLN